MNRPGQFYSNCQAGHQFSDTEELNMMRAQARAQFPGLYQVNAPPQADPALMAAQDIVINAEVKRAIEELVKQPITSGGDLKGIIYGYIHDNDDKDRELKTLKATVGTMRARPTVAGQKGPQPGQFIVQAPEWAIEGIFYQAEHENKTPEEWVSEQWATFCEQYFGAPAGGH